MDKKNRRRILCNERKNFSCVCLTPQTPRKLGFFIFYTPHSMLLDVCPAKRGKKSSRREKIFLLLLWTFCWHIRSVSISSDCAQNSSAQWTHIDFFRELFCFCLRENKKKIGKWNLKKNTFEKIWLIFFHFFLQMFFVLFFFLLFSVC